MHIPNGMLHGEICPVTAVVSTIVIGFVAFRAFFAKNKPSAAKFAAITALIFAGQMINFPVNNGTSGHLLGGILAVALLGVPFGILSMALVVTIQCLIFSDGGFTVLGANILNMAIIGAGLAGFIYKSFVKKFSLKSSQHFVGISIVSWFSIMMAALACSVELAISGTVPFLKVTGAMLSTHAFIGVGEALITVAACFAFASESRRVSQKRSVTVPLIASGIIAFVLSPFASGLPDGLEWVAAKFNFLHEAAPTFVSPLSGYTVAAVSNKMLATGLAGLTGVIITFFAGWIVANIVCKGSYLRVSTYAFYISKSKDT